MNPNHCVSLEIAQQLKEAGWGKETEFWWTEGSKFGEHRIETKETLDKEFQLYKYSEKTDYNYLIDGCRFYPAPLATEILEELPENISIKNTRGGFWRLIYGLPLQVKEGIIEQNTKIVDGKNFCDALAKMWLYLKKEKLL